MTLNEIAVDADAFLRSEVAAGRFRGAVLLALKSEVVLRSGYGLANEEWRLPNTPTTKFRIGSVTKIFTAAAILRLVEARAIDLSANIGTWLGDLPQAWQSFSIHQLLTHTAGLRDHVAAPAKRTLNRTGARPADLIDLIAGEPLLFQPGTSHSYSNTVGPLVLALYPAFGVGQLARSYVVNLFVFHAWGIVYALFSIWLTAINANSLAAMLASNSLGGFHGAGNALLVSLASILFAEMVALIPLFARRIVTGEIGSSMMTVVNTVSAAAGSFGLGMPSPDFPW